MRWAPRTALCAHPDCLATHKNLVPITRRAELPHRAPTSGRNAQALFGIGMQYADRWKPLGCQAIHTFARDPVALAPSSQGAKPQSVYLIAQDLELPLITGTA